MRVALLLPFSPTDPANSGVARLEMFEYLPALTTDRYHFGPATGGDVSIGRYHLGAHPKNLLGLIRLFRAFGWRHRRQPYQLIWTTMPPITMALFARLIARWYRLPLILDVRDPGIASVVLDHPPTSRTYQIAHRLERWLYRGAAAVTVTTPELASLLHQEFGVDRARMTVVSNATKDHQPNTTPWPAKPVRVFFAGTFAPYQVITPLISQLLRDRPTGFVFEFYGYDPKTNPALAEQVSAAKAADWLQLHPRLDRPTLFTKLRESHLVIVPIDVARYRRLYDYAVPLKLYEALAFSKPILLYGGTKAAKRLVRETGIGVISPVGDSLRPALVELERQYDRYATAAAKVVFSRKAEAQKLLAICRKIIYSKTAR